MDQIAHLQFSNAYLPVVLAKEEEKHAAGSQTDGLGGKGDAQTDLSQKSAHKITEGPGHALDGGGNGQVFAPVIVGGGVDHIGEKADKGAAGEETGEGPGEDHHGLGAGHAEESLSHGVADAADQHGLAAGDVVVELAPEGRKEEVCGLHSRQRHTEHIIVQIVFLDQGGGHWVGEAGRHKKGGEHHKKQEHMVGSGFLLHAVLPFPQ